jgi:hypothetical protein
MDDLNRWAIFVPMGWEPRPEDDHRVSRECISVSGFCAVSHTRTHLSRQDVMNPLRFAEVMGWTGGNDVALKKAREDMQSQSDDRFTSTFPTAETMNALMSPKRATMAHLFLQK